MCELETPKAQARSRLAGIAVVAFRLDDGVGIA
jgi:hypothetical protein